MSLGYISEKLSMAINAMATSASPIQKRLEYAAIGCITIAHGQFDKSFPDSELAQRWSAWWSSITNKDAEGNEGTLQATLGAMSDEDAENVAEELFSIYAAVEREYARQS